jgi:tetratricopeptide (TPR) repeat protein
MNVPDPTKKEYKMSMWPQQAIAGRAEDHYATIENLLEQTELTSQQTGKIPLLIEERTWLADTLRVQGKYDEASKLYDSLIKLTSLTGDDSNFTGKDYWCLCKAFIDYVDCGCFIPELSIEHLLGVIEKGIVWLESNVHKPDWAAGLQLERGLLLKNQGNLKDAFEEMRKALEKRKRSLDAPGYSLPTHKLELAELYCFDTIIHENEDEDALAKAADLVEEVLKDKDSTLNESRLANLILAEVRQKRGETVAVNNALREAQRLAYEIGRVEAAPNMRKLLGDLYKDTRQVAGVIAELDQTLKSIKEQSEFLRNAPTRSVETQESLPSIIADKARDSILTRHVSCYVSLPPFDEDKDSFYQNVLLPALRKILEFRPYYWQVGYRKDSLSYRNGKCQSCRGSSDEKCWLNCAQIYFADISERNPDVILELGYIWRIVQAEKRSLIILHQNPPGSVQQDKSGSINQFTFYPLSDLSNFVVSISRRLLKGKV